MERRKKLLIITLFTALFLLLSSLFANILLSYSHAEQQYQTTSDFVDWLIGEYPGDEQKIISYIKEYDGQTELAGKHHLEAYGFGRTAFWRPYMNLAIFSSVCCVLLFVLLLCLGFYFIRRKTRERIQSMTDYLSEANRGKEVSILPSIEDDFSILEDELYKTVTEIKTAKERAITERQNFAESLSNIAHQIKTPITSISVMIQRMKAQPENDELTKIKKQLDKINRLTDALLTISRIDAGILELKREPVNIYTLLELSVEAMENEIKSKHIEILLPNHPDISFNGDLDWSVEVFTNLIKNSVEHMPQNGRLSFQYEKNPLYVEICLTDNGEGFDEKEIPHIFNRFYRGTQSKKAGTGIGLSMAKSIIEMQNGFITAKNLPDGGACFLIRFYCH